MGASKYWLGVSIAMAWRLLHTGRVKQSLMSAAWYGIPLDGWCGSFIMCCMASLSLPYCRVYRNCLRLRSGDLCSFGRVLTGFRLLLCSSKFLCPLNFAVCLSPLHFYAARKHIYSRTFVSARLLCPSNVKQSKESMAMHV